MIWNRFPKSSHIFCLYLCGYIFYYLHFLEDINHFDNHIRNLYTKSTYLVDDQSWPPFTPKKIVSLLLIRHLEKQLDKQVPAITGSMEIAKNLKVNNRNSFTTNKISEIFQHGENVEAHNKIILILGVPGIGKTILSKEIAYQWADNKLLSEKETVLMLFLRDPNVKKIKYLKDFVHYFFGFSENAIKISTRCSNYLFQLGGSNVTIILDGLDEIPNDIINDTYLRLLLDRRALPSCRIIVTSRPAVSVVFKIKADTEVEIFGFTQKNISDFIRNEVKDKKQDKLMDYFKQNENLYHLCHIPFILSVLVCITKEYDELPSNRVELYKKFVVFTISCFLKRFEGPDYTISTIDELSVEYKSYLLELSKYAFNALEINQVVFTRKDVFIKDFPKLANAPETWYGLGLLNTVKYFKIAKSSDCVSYNFLHKSIQEFLAAYYITTLKTNEQLMHLKKYFYLDKYLNTWIMYIGLSQNLFPLKHFLSGNKLQISTKLLKFSNISTQSKIQRLYLFHCFSELKDSSLYDLIYNFFQYGNLDLSNHILSLKDIDTLVCILDRSSVTQWTQLNFSHCNIGDSRFHYLSIAVSNLNIELTLDTIDLSDNQLTIDSVIWVANFVRLCKTRVLYLSGNSMLDSDTKVISFAMNYANILNFALSVSYHHHEYIIYNGTDNSFLLNLSNKTDRIHGLFIFNYQFPGDNGAIKMLSNVIMKQELLTLLVLWNCGLSKINIQSVISHIMKKTNDKVLLVYEKGYDDSASVLLKELFQPTSVFTFVLFSATVLIFQNILNLQVEFFLFCVVPNCICDQLNYVVLSNCHFNSNTIQYFAAFICECHFLSKIVLYNNHLDVGMLILLLNILITIKSLKDIFVYERSIPSITYEGVVQRFADSKVALLLVNMSCVVALRTNEKQLIEINGTYDSFCQISWISLDQCIINVKVADWIFKMISSCVCVYMKDCIIETDSKMFTVLKNTSSLTTLNLNNNKMSEAEAEELAVAIIVNNSLEIVHLDNNHLGSSITSIANALQSLSSLKELSLNDCKCENLAYNIARVIANNTSIEQLSLKNNSLHPGDMMLICNSLSNVFNLRVINFKQNNITEEAAEELEYVISHNAGLEELYLGCNFLKLGGIKVAKGLQKISSVKVLDLEKNNLSNEVAEDLAAAVSINKSLEKLWLNDNCFVHSTAVILEGLKQISTLKVLDLNNNKDRSKKISAAITYVITKNKSLERLSLSNNNLNDNGIIKIAQSLCKHSNLKLINLQRNNITTKTAEALASIISSNTGLEELYLGNNQLQLGAAKISTALRNISSLKVLDLRNNNIPEEVADELSVAIVANNTLEKLWLNGNHLGSSTVMIVNALNEVTTLKELTINDNKNKSEELAPTIASAITKNKLLEVLSLCDNNLNDDGVIKIAQSLCKHSKLKHINLQYNNITEESAEALASIISSNTGLKKLYLGNNQLQLGVAKISTALKSISSLKVLDLQNNNISEQVADELTDAIRANNLLEKVWLNDNLGSSMAVIAKACSHNSSLIEFCCNNTGISVTATSDIAAVIRCNSAMQYLSMSDNNLQSSGLMIIAQAFKVTSSLKLLYACGINVTSTVSEELSSIIDHNLLLEELSLGDNLLENGLIHIAESCSRLINLKLLEFSHNCISPTQVVNLASLVSKCSSLEALSLGGICLSVDENLYLNVYRVCNHLHKELSNSLTQGMLLNKYLSDLMRMKICQFSLRNYDFLSVTYQHWYLYISYQHKEKFIGNNTDYDLVEAKQKLLHIDSKAMISSLQIIRTLKVINLENNNIDEDAVTELAGHLCCNNTLEQIWLRGNELYDKGATVVLQSLHNLSTLLILDLSFNHLSSESADGISVVIDNNCSLQQFWLDGNDLLTGGVVRIASALKKLSSLRILSLCSNGITDYAAEEISNVIANNVLLVDLLLGNNQLQATGVCKLAIALKKLFILRTLDLSNNHIIRDTAEELAVTLSNCTNLQQLFLDDNMLGTEGTIKIANALKCINSLQVLTLSNNNITESATDVLVGVLKNNISLKIVLIGGNDLRATGVNLIVQTAKNITTLQLLDVSENNVSEDEKENFRTIFANYNNFTIVV